MAKGMTPEQVALLEYASEADDRYRIAKANARKRAEQLARQEIAKFEAVRDQAVFDAIEAGISKRQVGLQALKTSSPNTVQEIYNRVAAERTEVEPVELPERTIPKYQWSAVLTHPVSGLKFAFLQVHGDDHWNQDPEGKMDGSGYLFYNTGNGFVPRPDDKPSPEAIAWADGNQPEE